MSLKRPQLAEQPPVIKMCEDTIYRIHHDPSVFRLQISDSVVAQSK